MATPGASLFVLEILSALLSAILVSLLASLLVSVAPITGLLSMLLPATVAFETEVLSWMTLMVVLIA